MKMLVTLSFCKDIPGIAFFSKKYLNKNNRVKNFLNNRIRKKSSVSATLVIVFLQMLIAGPERIHQQQHHHAPLPQVCRLCFSHVSVVS
jgi:hypothetical protein